MHILGVAQRYAVRDTSEELVGDGAAGGGDVVGRDSLAPELDRVADAGVWHVAEVDREHVHRDPADDAAEAAIHRDRRAVRRVPRIAVGIAAGNRGHSRGPP